MMKYLGEYDFDLFTSDSGDDYPTFEDLIEDAGNDPDVVVRFYSTPAEKTNAEVAQSDRASAF